MYRLSLVFAMVALAACGSVYQSPEVTAGPQVEVIEMTTDSVARANQSIYQPRVLPAAFGLTAGAGISIPVTGVTPDAALSVPVPTPAIQTRMPENTDPGPYRIGVGDVLRLSTPASSTVPVDLAGTLAAQNAQQGYAVQDDGAINIPNVGRVMLAGRTQKEAEAALFQVFVQNELDPGLGLEMVAFNARKVSVGGAVAEPTIVPITLTPVYLNEALTRAGGLTLTTEDQGALRLYRGGTLYQIPLAQYRNRPDLQRLQLMDGDSIHVDAGTDLAQAQAYFEQQIALAQVRAETRETALLELSTQVALRRNELIEARQTFESGVALEAVPRDYVYLMGEVARQSRFALPFAQQASLADALLGAGDGVPAITGDVSQIYVLRRDTAGSVAAWRLDGRNAASFTLAPRFQLRPDDVIFVAQQPITKWSRVLSQLTSGAANTSFTRSLD